jgi:6-phosphogluconate dehydrogenase
MDIGLIGLAVMGENLALNIAYEGPFPWCLQQDGGKDAKIHGLTRRKSQRAKSKTSIKYPPPTVLNSWFRCWERPRKNNADGQGRQAVDDLLEDLKPLLDYGDLS